jgi:hypothetical protein
LKDLLSSARILSCSDHSLPIIVSTDASTEGVGACLSQVHDGVERIVAFYSRTLIAAEKRYAVNELEALACVVACEKWHFYL